MRCECCQGTGMVFAVLMGLPGDVICAECQGSGVAYCCDEAGANPPNIYKQGDELLLEQAVMSAP